MAAVTIHNDFRAQEEEICHLLPPFPLMFAMNNGAGRYDLSFIFNTEF